MNIRQWNLIITTSECKSFSKAAEKLFISTPALVQQINLIEKEIGFPIFKRSKRGIILTEAGLMFCSGIKDLSETYQALLNDCQTAHDSSILSLRVASPGSTTPPDLFEIVHLFEKRFTRTQISFVVSDYERIIPDLISDNFDIAFFFDSALLEGKQLVFEPMYDDQMVLCMSKKHRLAMKKMITISDLQNETIHLPYTYQYTSIGRQIFDARKRGVPIELNTEEFNESIMLQSQFGHLIVPMPLRYSETYQKNFAIIPMLGAIDNYGLIHHPNPSSICKQFIDCAKDYYHV